VVAVGGGDVVVPTQEADRQAAERRHDAGRVPCPDQGLVFLVGDVAGSVELVLCLAVPAASGGLARSAVRRQPPMVGAQCGNPARWDLSEGLPARAVPTATRVPASCSAGRTRTPH
jgi:hypothetical protein